LVEDLARALCATLETEALFRVLAQRLPQLVEHSHLCLALYSEERGAYVIEHSAAREGAQPLAVGTELRPPQHGLRPPEDFRRPVYEEEAPRDESAWPLTRDRGGPQSAVFLPISVDGSCLGALVLGSRERGAFAPEEIGLLESMALYLAIALRNARLYRESQDALRELRATQHELIRTEKQRELGEMAAGIAHQLNNSLGGILGFVELALAQTSEESLADLLAELRKAALDAAETVSRINLFGRQQPGEEKRVATDLGQLAEGTLMLTRYKWQNLALMEGSRIETETQFDECAPVWGKPNELREVVTNLIMNAVDAMPDGGTLGLRTYCEGNWACLSLSDTGVGMDPDTLSRVFDRHFTTKGDGGSGVGLSISRELVRAHDGELEVASEVGKGSVFTLRLPLREDPGAEAPLEAPASAQPASGAPLRVLLAEDDPGVQEVVALMLEYQGLQVQSVGTGRAAIEAFAAGSFDLLITDMRLPEGTGDAVAQRIHEQSPSTPIVLMTGLDDALSEALLARWGVACVLRKPVTIQDLGEVVALARERAAPSPEPV
jgi:signal transduction histidine kinase/ActR/RegA family two-component response regulator